MYIGQFPSDDYTLVDGHSEMTQMGVQGRFGGRDHYNDRKSTDPSKPKTANPFPKVDDIIDRLTNDTEVEDLRTRTR